MRITMFQKANGSLSKRLYLDGEGNLVKDGSLCAMSAGVAQVQPLNSKRPFEDLAGKITGMTSDKALALGVIRDVNGTKIVKVTVPSMLSGAEGAICRSQKFMHYRRRKPAMVLLDFDTDRMPDEVR